MTDVAVLGLAIDSRPAVAATQALNGLAAAARPAAQGAAALQTAAAGANTALTNAARGADLAGRRHGALGGSLQQLSFQLNDIASGLAMGQSPFMIMAQQGGQVFQVWQQNNNIFKDAGRFFLNLITPMRALAVGAAAVGIAGYAMRSSWKAAELQLDDTARAAGMTVKELRALEAAASGKGIDTKDFLDAAEKLGRATYQARNNMGGLAEVFRANGVQVGSTADNFARLAELIKNAKNDQQRLSLLQQAGLPATAEWLRLMEGGSAAIKKAVDEAVKFNEAANSGMVAKAREFDEAWDKAWKNFSLAGRSAFVDVSSWLDQLGDKATGFMLKIPVIGEQVPKNMLKAAGKGVPGFQGTTLTQSSADSFYDSMSKSFPKNLADGPSSGGKGSGSTIDPQVLMRQIAAETPRLGLLGQTPPAKQAEQDERKAA